MRYWGYSFMRKELLVALLGSAFVLVACGETKSTDYDSSSTETPSSVAFSESISSAPSSESSSTLSQESSTSSAVSSTSEKEEPAESWTLTLNSDLLISTQQSQYLNDYPFQATRSDGQTVSFFGDYIQPGHGEWDGTIQMKKYESYIYSKSAFSSCHVSMGIKIRAYNGDDFSGVPTFYAGQSEDPTIEKTPSVSEKEGVRVFEFDMEGYFKLANLSQYAMYVISIEFAAN